MLKKRKRNEKIIYPLLVIIVIIILISIVSYVTYSIFSFSGEGSIKNSIITGNMIELLKCDFIGNEKRQTEHLLYLDEHLTMVSKKLLTTKPKT